MDPDNMLDFIKAVSQSMGVNQPNDLAKNLQAAFFRQLENTGNAARPLTESYPYQMANSMFKGDNSLYNLKNFSRAMLPESMLNDMGTRANAAGGLGEYISRIMLSNMQYEHPEQWQFMSNPPPMKYD